MHGRTPGGSFVTKAPRHEMADSSRRSCRRGKMHSFGVVVDDERFTTTKFVVECRLMFHVLNMTVYYSTYCFYCTGLSVPVARVCRFCQMSQTAHPSIDEFDICDVTKGHLRARGITTLFPIQVCSSVSYSAPVKLEEVEIHVPWNAGGV